MQPDTEPQLIDLREFLSVLRRRKWSVLLVTIVVVGVALALVYRRTPVYTSVAEVEVRALTAQAAQYGGFYDLQSSMDTEAQRVTTASIAKSAETLGAPADASVSASVPANTTFLDISCTTPDPASAKACADAYAQAYVKARVGQAQGAYRAATAPLQEQLTKAEERAATLTQDLKDTTDPTVRASLVQDIASVRNNIDSIQLQILAVPAASATAASISFEGNLPVVPANKGYITTTILAVILGLALGTGLAFIRERLDERLGDRHDMERALGAPVLAVVPKVPGWRNRSDAKLVTVTAPNGAAAEAYRTARTTLLYLAKEGGMKVFAVTGPGQGEGKTTTTANLAVALAQAGKRVIAVSCDLRKPRLYRFFGADNRVGVSQVLTGTVDVPSALKKTSVPGLVLMSSGPVPQNPAELLSSPQMSRLVEELRKVSDVILLDTPPSLVVADTLGLVPMTDGVIVVADADGTARTSLAHLRSQLEQVGGTVIGGVVNNLDAAAAKRYRGYGQYYGDPAYGQPTNGDSTNGNANGTSRRARRKAERASLEEAER